MDNEILDILVEVGDCGDECLGKLSARLPKCIQLAEVVYKIQEERPTWKPLYIMNLLLQSLQAPNPVECLSFQQFTFDGTGAVERAVAATFANQWPNCRVRTLDFRMSIGLQSKHYAAIHDAVHNLKHVKCHAPDTIRKGKSNDQLPICRRPSSFVAREGSELSFLNSCAERTAYAKQVFASHNITLLFLVDMKENRKLSRFIGELIAAGETEAVGNDLLNAKEILEQDPSVKAESNVRNFSKRIRDDALSQDEAEAILKKFKFSSERVLVPRDRLSMEEYAAYLESRGKLGEGAELRLAIGSILRGSYSFVSYRKPRTVAATVSERVKPDLPPVEDPALKQWAQSMWTGYTVEDVLRTRQSDIVDESILRHGEGTHNQEAMLCAAKVLLELGRGSLPSSLRSQALQLMLPPS
jgi:hypothetical protein